MPCPFVWEGLPEGKIGGEDIRGCVPDGVTSPQTDPLWDRSVLLLGSGELLLRAEGFVTLHTHIISLLSSTNFFLRNAPLRHHL